jgi:hypothetical protein
MQECSSWRVDIRFHLQEFPAINRITKVYYPVHKSLIPNPTLRKTNPVHTVPTHFPKINLISSSHLHQSLPNGIVPLGLPANIFNTYDVWL